MNCPHCGKVVELTLEAAKPLVVRLPEPMPSTSKAKAKAKMCACGHDAAKHEDLRGKCTHGAGTAFGGCTCTAFHSRRRTSSHAPVQPAGGIGSGEMAILRAIVQCRSMSSAHLTVMTGYKRSTRDAYLRRLFGRSLVYQDKSVWRATPEGLRAAGPFEPLPTGDALRNYHLDHLPEGEASVLAFVCGHYPDAVDRDAITASTGYKRSTRDAYVRRLLVRKLLHVDANLKGVRASTLLFEGSE